jgi:hypothetical protein
VIAFIALVRVPFKPIVMYAILKPIGVSAVVHEVPQTEAISIEARGEDFALVRTDENGNRTELALSWASLIFFGRMLPQTLQKITAMRANRKREGSPAIAVPLQSFRLGVDVEAAELLVTMIDRFGNEMGFALSPDIARPFGQHLLLRVAELEGSAKRSPDNKTT